MKLNNFKTKIIGTAIDKKGFAAGALTSFSLFTIFSHPKSPIYQKLPRGQAKKFQFLPNIRWVSEDKAYHFHHWMIFTLIYIPIIVFKPKILNKKTIHGLILGTIIQGLIYKDRFQIVY